MESEKLLKAYQFFYKAKYKEIAKITNINKESLSKLDYSFLKTDDDLFFYMFMSFARKELLDLLETSGKINFNMIFGKKSIEVFLTRNKSKDSYILQNSIVNSYIIKKNFLRFIGPKDFKPVKIGLKVSYESFIRTKCNDSDRGFVNCIENTTLYDPSDKSCLKCCFKNDCIELLKQNYTNLYIKRIGSLNKNGRK